MKNFVILLIVFAIYCDGSEPLYRDTRGGCKKRESCQTATEDCFVGSMVFREITTMCDSWKKKKDAGERTDYFEDSFCDPARIALSCSHASSSCEEYCDKKHAL